ncbi:hypothetical protein HNQ36_000512 [Afipia massiliensis]|uniref:Uncharacterized protein n=1 Tax=Afipia massiliensis TaxID=211460 RepID=A0A840MVU5_9BRAD|nr:hypothetical protein [Afipia massiliensis]MBB5050564.1 hypothetical protein [Afipia massiliensis]
MPRKPSSTPVKKPVAKKAACKTAAKTAVRKVAVRKTTAKKPVATKPEKAKRSRAKVLKEHPGNLVADASDHVAIDAIESANAKASGPVRVSNRRSAVDRINDPPSDQPPATSMVERVSDAIERELTKIERIVGNPTRMAPARRIETESRARVLASLARTLKEVMRLREQERGAGDDNAKAADDDAIPRDLDEFRRELSRRLEGLVADAAALPAGGDEPG